MKTMPDNTIKFVDQDMICAFMVPLWTDDHSFEGMVYAVYCWDQDGTPSSANTEDGEFEQMATFRLKWDGCSHLHLADQANSAVHICGQGSMERLLRMLQWMWLEAQARIPKYDTAVAG